MILVMIITLMIMEIGDDDNVNIDDNSDDDDIYYHDNGDDDNIDDNGDDHNNEKDFCLQINKKECQHMI